MCMAQLVNSREGRGFKAAGCVLSSRDREEVGRLEWKGLAGGERVVDGAGSEGQGAGSSEVGEDGAAPLVGTNVEGGRLLVDRGFAARDDNAPDIDYTSFLGPAPAGNESAVTTGALTVSNPCTLPSRRYPIEARIGDLGSNLGIGDITFTFLEILLDIASLEPRPTKLAPHRPYEYSSEREDVYVWLKPREPRSARYEHVVRGLWAVAHTMDWYNRWQECDFVILVDGQAVIDGRIRKEVVAPSRTSATK